MQERRNDVLASEDGDGIPVFNTRHDHMSNGGAVGGRLFTVSDGF